MSVSAESEPSPRPSAVRSSPNWWDRPRWADGRLISPRDDGIALWIKFLSWGSAAIGFWLLGLAGSPISATVPGAPLVVMLIVAVAAGAARVVTGRAHSLVERGPWDAASLQYVLQHADGSESRWRPARWPDGRYVVAGDAASFAAGFIAAAFTMLALWLLGQMSVQGVSVAQWWEIVALAMMLPFSIVGMVSNRRLKALAAEDAAAGDGTSGGASLRAQ